MEAIAVFMQNESAVIAVGIIAMMIGFVGLLVLGAVSFVSAFMRRLPGGYLAFAGYTIIIAMYAFATLMTSTMELQYGPQGAVVEAAVYTLGGFLCVLGYARLAWWNLRNRSEER
jgi:hypothetical protein